MSGTGKRLSGVRGGLKLSGRGMASKCDIISSNEDEESENSLFVTSSGQVKKNSECDVFCLKY